MFEDLFGGRREKQSSQNETTMGASQTISLGTSGMERQTVSWVERISTFLHGLGSSVAVANFGYIPRNEGNNRIQKLLVCYPFDNSTHG